jgi:hypothetical protein
MNESKSRNESERVKLLVKETTTNMTCDCCKNGFWYDEEMHLDLLQGNILCNDCFIKNNKQ